MHAAPPAETSAYGEEAAALFAFSPCLARRVCAVPGRSGRARTDKRGQAGVPVSLLLPAVHVCAAVRVSLPRSVPALRAPQLPHPIEGRGVCALGPPAGPMNLYER